MCAYELSWCMRCVVEPVYHREKTVASSGSCCPRLRSMARLDTIWKAAFQVQRYQNSRLVGLGKILNRFDHLVGSILTSDSVLESTCRFYD